MTNIPLLLYEGMVVPPEVMQKYGDMTNWKNSVGTGPFMLTDWIPGSEAVYVRNPNYWMKDPIGPGKGNQLPYLDGVSIVILPDASTQQAALRTAKIDQISGYNIEDDSQHEKDGSGLEGSTVVCQVAYSN